MSDDIGAAPSGGETQAASEVIQGPADKPVMSARDAASFLASLRHRRDNPESQQDATAEEPVVREPALPENDAETTETASADVQETAKEPEKTEKPADDWQKRYEELQRQHETLTKQRPQEIDAANKARQQYEQALPALMEMLNQQGAEFADIKTVADVAKLAETDPHRYLKFDAYQKSRAAVNEQIRQAQEQQESETAKRWDKFSAEQDEKFLKKFPEFTDKTKAEKATAAALTTLRDAGFETDELTDLWNGRSGVSLRDARLQEIMFKAARFDEAQRAAKEAKAKPMPPVVRPGVAQPKGGDTAQVKVLSERLNQTGNWKDAAKLLIEHRRAQAR